MHEIPEQIGDMVVRAQQNNENCDDDHEPLTPPLLIDHYFTGRETATF